MGSFSNLSKQSGNEYFKTASALYSLDVFINSVGRAVVTWKLRISSLKIMVLKPLYARYTTTIAASPNPPLSVLPLLLPQPYSQQ